MVEVEMIQKMAIHGETELEFHIFKVTIREQQACNLVNANASIYLYIAKVQLFLFSTKTNLQKLRFDNTIDFRVDNIIIVIVVT